MTALKLGLSPFQVLCVLEHEGGLAFRALPGEERTPHWRQCSLFHEAVLEVLGLDDSSIADGNWSGLSGSAYGGDDLSPRSAHLPSSAVRRFTGAALATAIKAGTRAAIPEYVFIRSLRVKILE